MHRQAHAGRVTGVRPMLSPLLDLSQRFVNESRVLDLRGRVHAVSQRSTSNGI